MHMRKLIRLPEMRRLDLVVTALWLCVNAVLVVKPDSGAGDVAGQRCRDELPASYVNDDFCDCVDGSDEPGIFFRRTLVLGFLASFCS